jgi:glycosyltransferase involved in cell wall biosynthesis
MTPTASEASGDYYRTRVTILARQLVNAGAERQLYLLATHLVASGWDTRVVTLGDHLDREYWSGPLRDAGVAVRHVAADSVIARARRLRRVLREHAPGIIHAFHIHAAPYAFLARDSPRTPVVSGIRSLPEPWYLRPTLWERVALYGSAALVCNSGAALAYLRRRFPRCPPAVAIANGVMLPALDQRDAIRDAARRRLGAPANTPVVGIVARLVPEKRVDIFLHAIAALRGAHPQMRAVVVGTGPATSKLAHLARELGCAGAVQFTGELDDAANLLPAFDVLCLSSDTEGVPNVLLEAAAWCVPVVATSVGGVPEAVHHDVTGYLVPPRDGDQLAGRVDQLLRSPGRRAAMGVAARQHVAATFAVRRMGASYEALYARVSPPSAERASCAA